MSQMTLAYIKMDDLAPKLHKHCSRRPQNPLQPIQWVLNSPSASLGSSWATLPCHVPAAPYLSLGILKSFNNASPYPPPWGWACQTVAIPSPKTYPWVVTALDLVYHQQESSWSPISNFKSYNGLTRVCGLLDWGLWRRWRGILFWHVAVKRIGVCRIDRQYLSKR